MRKGCIITSLVVVVAVIVIIGLAVGLVYRNRKRESDTATNEIIWSFHLENDADLKIKGTLDDIINVDILKKEDYSVGGHNVNVKSFSQDFPTAKLTGWTYTFQPPLRIRKFIVGSNEVVVSKIIPISGFTVFNNQDLGDFVTIWHDGDFHHYSKSGELISIGPFPFANGDDSIHPRGLKIPTRISEDGDLDFNPVHGFPSGWHDRVIAEEPKEPEIESVSFDPVHGFPSGWHDNIDMVEVPVTFVNVLPKTLNLTSEDLVFDLSVITLATEDTPYTILQGDDEMIIKKNRIDEVFNKYSCSFTNERPFKPQIRHLLSNFKLEVDDVSEFELYAGEYDEPLLIRLKNPYGWNTYVHSGDNKWTIENVSSINTNVLDKYYVLLRDDITMIDCSKKSGKYKFGKYRIEVTEPGKNDPELADSERNDSVKHDSFKTYTHTIYHDSDYAIDFASVKVHRFKYDNIALKGFIRYHSIRKVHVYFWEHELTKPIYIRASADHGFANYFGYPNYVMQTDVSLFPYFLKVTNFEVNDALVINLARHEKYDFEGGVSPHLTRHQVTVTLHDNSPIKRFRRNVHTLTVGGVNKPFNILRFLNEVNLNVDITKVSSVEAYYHNKHLKKALMFILNGSSKQSFYKLEDDNYVKMDNLIVNLENTIKYLAYYNYNYVSIDVSKSSNYHYTGASDPSSLPDPDLLVSVVKEEFKEFSKFTHSLTVNNQQSKFKIIALNGVDINFDDPELTSVDCYFFNEHKDTPIAVVLRGTPDVVYAIKKSHPIKKDATFLTSLNDSLRNLVQYNFGLLYLRLDQTANYYNKEDYGFEIEVVQEQLSEGNYTKYVHKFPAFSDISFVVDDNYYHTKIEPEGNFKTAIVFKNKNKFPEIVTLIDVKASPRYFIYQDNIYKRAKEESVNKKLGIPSSSQQAAEGDQS